MASTACFVIVGRNDCPIYESEVGTAPKKDEATHLHQFILHAALDVVQDAVWLTNGMFLKTVDRFNDLYVSVYVTAGHTRLMLLHDSKNDDGIRNFFQEVHELYIKLLLNPLYVPGSRITSSYFDTRQKKPRTLLDEWIDVAFYLSQMSQSFMFPGIIAGSGKGVRLFLRWPPLLCFTSKTNEKSHQKLCYGVFVMTEQNSADYLQGNQLRNPVANSSSGSKYLLPRLNPPAARNYLITWPGRGIALDCLMP
ncbi:hypothetical protein R1flu_010955 [Riccia fluitans]|uniref:Trafficking protein particle complex subunit 2 n=1 Tax=Riccia fluitans TaxID=41844 RepID=A0ABD1Z7D9_9MARC